MIDLIVRARLWILGAVALMSAGLDLLGEPRTSDFFRFEAPARVLFSSRAVHALDAEWVQVGPLALLWPALNDALAALTGLSDQLVFAVTVYLVLVFGVIGLIRLLFRGSRQPLPGWIELAIGLVVVAGGVAWTALSSGQPFDALVGAAWVLTAWAARRDRPVLAGSFLGIACAIKLTAALGVPLLLLLPTVRRVVGGAAVALAIALIAYLPFFTLGDSGMFEFAWHVSRNSFVSWLVTPGTEFAWPMRLVQSVVVVGAGATVALRFRRSFHVVWVAPLTIAVLRVVTDPLSFGSYWLGAEIVALCGIALLLPRESAAVRIALLTGAAVVGLAHLVPGMATELRLLIFGAFIVFLLRGRRLSAPVVEQAATPV